MAGFTSFAVIFISPSSLLLIASLADSFYVAWRLADSQQRNHNAGDGSFTCLSITKILCCLCYGDGPTSSAMYLLTWCHWSVAADHH
ncbi:hypothetical protein Nepgr_028210 [Nepenthes gracilis]|uniref:Uncharacterized protein n=1 Tax=Nepenthes gracilis TaxID=150966 RepID=A0AAD3Y1W8_NEPGR|nr:hypothetical protein Nepgr_028210 [Nepenthes gracilis]